jgi:PAS domain S-box-containing protein
MVAILDSEGKILDCNNRVCTNTGFSKKELIGLIGPIDLVAKKDRGIAMDAFQIVQNGIELNTSFEMKRKNKSLFPTLWSGSALFDDQDTLQGYLVTGKDVSELDRLKNQLNESYEHLKNEKLITIGEISARMAHDLRTPLSVINGALVLLESQHLDGNNEQSRRYVQTIKRNLEKIEFQIDHVLDFVKTKPLQIEPLLLKTLIESSIGSVNVPQGISIELPTTDFTIDGDFNQLEIVFVNLITNSIQALGQDGTISFNFEFKGDSIEIKLIDSADMISDEDLSRLFEPLYSKKQTGIGLGLSSCKIIIENHGGKINAINHPTTFTIILPKK